MSEFSSVSWDAGDNQLPGEQVEPYGGDGSAAESAGGEGLAGLAGRDGPGPLSGEQEGESSAGPSSRKALERDDIYVTSVVSDPQKEQDGSQNAYISYLIATDSNSPTFQSSRFRVRRRFSDFLYLYMSLVNEYPACAVPPLPDKQRLEYIKGDRFGPEFTLKRATSLNRFLNRISHHPVLKRSKTYFTFLESGDWNSYKKRGVHAPEAQDSGVLDGISDSFLNAFSKVNNQSQELLQVKERVDKLDDNLSHIEKSFSRIVRRQGDLVHDLEEFANQMIKLSTLEPRLESQFKAFAAGIQSMARGVYILREQIDSDYNVSLRDMENYVVSLKSLLKLREQKQLDYEALTDYLTKATQDRNFLLAGGGSNFLRSKVEDIRGVNHEEARKERLRKLEGKIEDLTREAESAKITSESFEDLTFNEVGYFDKIKELEMKDTLGTLARNNIGFFEGVINEWERLVEEIEADSIEHAPQGESTETEAVAAA